MLQFLGWGRNFLQRISENKVGAEPSSSQNPTESTVRCEYLQDFSYLSPFAVFPGNRIAA